MKYYQVKEISQMTSLTVRSLQYYDDINLLKPSKRSDAGYRLYSEGDLLRLQQIITLKYLGFSLSAVREIIEKPGFNIIDSMDIQAQELISNAKKIKEASSLLIYISSQMKAGQPINWNSCAKIIELLDLNTMNKQTLNKYSPGADHSELGKKSEYISTYDPDRLYPIARVGKREEIGIKPGQLPFKGFDCWNHYEVSWLNPKGKPMVAVAQIVYDCSSPKLIESKSLKLYFNSFNNTSFESTEALEKIIKQDLEKAIEADVMINIYALDDARQYLAIEKFKGECIDHLDVTCSVYQVEPSFLAVSDEIIAETLYSDLLKSNCLVTNQPDWGTVQIAYRGKKINHEGLLKYLVSFRNHNEFHEQCIERIFVDIMNYCKPESLTVYGRYTRRGGLDINPFRSTEQRLFEEYNPRLVRQ